jgi:hypothetical protein
MGLSASPDPFAVVQNQEYTDGGFSFPSLLERQNALVIRTALDMMTSPDDVTRKLMRQFEKEQAANC